VVVSLDDVDDEIVEAVAVEPVPEEVEVIEELDTFKRK